MAFFVTKVTKDDALIFLPVKNLQHKTKQKLDMEDTRTVSTFNISDRCHAIAGVGGGWPIKVAGERSSRPQQTRKLCHCNPPKGGHNFVWVNEALNFAPKELYTN